MDKLLRKKSPFSMDGIRKMHDTLGGRVIVYFLSDLPLIDGELRRSKLLEISTEDRPVAYLSKDLAARFGLGHHRRASKDSGYASIHYVVRFKPEIVADPRPWFEIQLRTMVEDTWGNVEHVLGYKPGKFTTFAVRRQFQILASVLGAVDEHFNFLRDELSRFQVEVKIDDAHTLNAENLPLVLSEFGIGCAQFEINAELKILASRGITKVGALRENCTSKRLDVIRSVFLSETGQSPKNFDVVAAIATIHGKRNERNIGDAIRAQIVARDAWYALQKELGDGD